MSSVSKVVFGNTTIMDITDSTVDSDTLLTGTRAYGANGDPVIGGVVKSWTGTMAQYTQEASQIPDGTQVNILDDFTTAGEPMGIADIYSTAEREIGVWIDGKPLYQKTWALQQSIESSTWVELTAVNLSGVEQLVSCVICRESAINDVILTVREYGISTNAKLQIVPLSSNAMMVDKVTLKYTKTTDQPGSGKYVPSGAPAVHYSTDEQVIGTWIDGKPLYQKTVHETNIIIPQNANAYFDIAEGAANCKLISAEGSRNFMTSIPYTDPTFFICGVINDTTNKFAIKVYRNGSSLTLTDVCMTYRYTKTTD